MMGSIAGTATAGVSSAAAEAASGSMSVGNIRMNNVNMNKYDAAQTMDAGTSSKLSMDHQQTASNQSSVRTGTEISNKDIDENVHKGSTWITDSQTGKTYEVNGTFDQTSGGWTGSGTINEYDKNGNFVGSYKGEISGTGNMSDYQKDVVQGGQGGRENAFQAVSVVSTNLDASNVKHEDNISTANKIEQNNDIKEAKKVEDTRDVTRRGSETVEGNKFTHDSSTTVTTGVKEDHSNIRQTGDKETNYGRTQEYSNAYGSLMAGGHDGVHADMYRDFVAMKNGNISQEQFEAKVMNYAKQVSADMPSSLSKDMSFGQGSDARNTNSSSESTQINETMKFGVDGSIGPDLKGAGSAGVNFGAGMNAAHSNTNESSVSNTQSYTNQRGGSASQDMMAQHIKNEIIGNMESLYKNGGMTHNGESVGHQLSNELSDFVGGKVNKPF